MGARIDNGTKLSVEPKIIAVITAALAVGGYLNPGDRVVGIKKYGQMNPWKYQGMIDIMTGRDNSLK